MTPAARVSAAIEVLDQVLSGTPVEKALTNWGRRNRYAGSKDRAAVRDHVFDAYRRLRSSKAIGGGATGRAVLIGAMAQSGADLKTIFTGERFAPSPLTDGEKEHLALSLALPEDVEVDCPAWLWPQLKAEYGDQAVEISKVQQRRAPIFLRVNIRKASREVAAATLAEEEIETRDHPDQETALEVVSNPRRVQQSRAFKDGIVELQDASSQAIADHVPLQSGQSVLDYCAGGGGKTLAMAARVNADFVVHDIDERRLAPLGERAKRAGVRVRSVAPNSLSSSDAFDVVLCDVPCSGSGAWRRSPEGKWALTEERLQELVKSQGEILDTAAQWVRPGGFLVHATCSILRCENEDQIDAFLLRHPNWKRGAQKSLQPSGLGDGLFAQVLVRPVK